MEPFLKWAGGKRWLIAHAENLLPKPADIGNYYEPFLGGGSVFFHLCPTRSVLSDLNPELINAYTAIRDQWFDVYQLLCDYHLRHSKKFYYKIRASRPRTALRKAARFLYLNRTCWNGLYRVNQLGIFNVPIGTKNTVVFNNDDFFNLSAALQDTELVVCDFEITINRAGQGDFLFIDPPYTVRHNLNGFLKYNEKIFSWEDQERLKNAVERAIERGANVLVTNANHVSITELYHGIGNMHLLNRASVIAGDPSFRGACTEIAITSW